MLGAQVNGGRFVLSVHLSRNRLFSIQRLLGIFLEQDPEIGRVVALDEAHKVLRELQQPIFSRRTDTDG